MLCPNRSGAEAYSAACAARQRLLEYAGDPVVRLGIDHEMHPVLAAAIGDAVRIGEAQVPAAAGLHHDARAVEPEIDRIVGDDRDVQPHRSVLETEIGVEVLLDHRSRRQPHQPTLRKGALEAPDDLAKVWAGFDQRRVGEIDAAGWRRRSCATGCRLARRGAQRDDRPVALVVLP